MTRQGDEPSLRRNEQRLASLKERRSSIPPLKLRRVQPRKPTPVISLCDWTNEEVRERLPLTCPNSGKASFMVVSVSGCCDT